jgi:3',5'-cyclic AMP phosphodiesterase CpdA
VLIERRELSAAIFMGDLTDIGKLDGYKSATAYIAGALQLGGQGIHSSLPTGILPGNHDIDRNLAAQPSSGARGAPRLRVMQEERR